VRQAPRREVSGKRPMKSLHSIQSNIFYIPNMLDPIRTARVLGSLIVVQGVVLLAFWKILGTVIATATARYANFSGKMAKAFFSQDKALINLLQTGESYLIILLVLGLLISFLGIIMIALPKQTMQILLALRILSRWTTPQNSHLQSDLLLASSNSDKNANCECSQVAKPESLQNESSAANTHG